MTNFFRIILTVKVKATYKRLFTNKPVDIIFDMTIPYEISAINPMAAKKEVIRNMKHFQQEVTGEFCMDKAPNFHVVLIHNAAIQKERFIKTREPFSIEIISMSRPKLIPLNRGAFIEPFTQEEIFEG